MARGELNTKDEYGSCSLDIDERRHRGCQVEKAPRIPKQCSPLPAARLLQNNVGADQMRCTVPAKSIPLQSELSRGGGAVRPVRALTTIWFFRPIELGANLGPNLGPNFEPNLTPARVTHFLRESPARATADGNRMGEVGA
ncbi:hypothetical protein C8J57DRAFT_1216715 [Mycena rebaudengoi]|nr:hypothetical protein C8J57DRAFT_1216715 [Mycena rebaudengoi]